MLQKNREFREDFLKKTASFPSLHHRNVDLGKTTYRPHGVGQTLALGDALCNPIDGRRLPGITLTPTD